MSGPIPAPPSVVTADGSRLVITGVPVQGDLLIHDEPGVAHWGPFVDPGLPAGLLNALNLKFWFKAESLTVAGGAPANPWANSAASGGALSTAEAAPVFRAAGGPNNLPWVDSPGGVLNAGGPNTPTGDLTYFMVIKPSAAYADTESIFGSSFNGALHGAEIGLAADRTVFLNQSGIVSRGVSVAALPTDRWSFVCVTIAVATNTFMVRVNDIVRTVVNGGAPWVFDANPLQFGRYQSISEYYRGGVVEFGGWGSVLSDGDLRSLQAFVTAKYGL